MLPIRAVPFSDRKDRHVKMPRVWYSFPSLLLSNVTSLINKMEDLIVSVRSTCADNATITEAWQIVSEVSGERLSSPSYQDWA